MELKEAIEILKRHNLWRRDRNDVSSIKMEHPKTLGIAIDIIIEHFEPTKNNPMTFLDEAISAYEVKDPEIVTPKHYNNDNGTLYKVANERGWNSYIFDVIKRLERAEKKGEFKQDLEKSIAVIQLWQKESKK